jgi:hypothetical protein
MIADDQSGYLCTYHPGTVYVDVISGVHKAREAINITGGSGVCQYTPQIVPPRVVIENPPVVTAPVVLQPQPIPPSVLHHVFRLPPINPNALIVPAPPPPAVAPAPPPAAGTAKKEEKQQAFEDAGQKGDEGGATHQALATEVGRSPVNETGLVFGATAVMLLLTLGLALTRGVPRPATNAGFVREPGRRREY